MNNELHSFFRSYNRKSQGTKNQPRIDTNHSPDTKEAKLKFHWIRYREALYWRKCKKYLVKKGDLTAFGKQDSLKFGQEMRDYFGVFVGNSANCTVVSYAK